MLFGVENFTSNSVNVGLNLEVHKDAEVFARLIAIAASLTAVYMAVSKAIANSTITPLQIAAIVLGCAAGAGAIFVATNALYRVVYTGSVECNSLNYISTSFTYPTTTTGSNFTYEGVKKFGDDFQDSFSDLMLLIISIDTLACVCLNLFFILFMMILFKFFFEDNIKLNFSRFIGEKYNNSLNYYLIKLIQFYKKTSTVYIFIIFIVLFIVLAFNIYFISQLFLNLDTFIDLHIKNRK